MRYVIRSLNGRRLTAELTDQLSTPYALVRAEERGNIACQNGVFQ